MQGVIAHVVFYDDEKEGRPVKATISQKLEELVPGCEKLLAPEKPDGKTWCFAFTRADYERVEWLRLNHVVPLFQKEKMVSGTWSMVSESEKSKISKRIATYTKMLQAMDNSDSDESETDLKASLRKYQCQKEFLEILHTMDLHAASVKGDGNCMLWSFLAHDAGPVVRDQMANLDHVNALRKETSCLVVLRCSTEFQRFKSTKVLMLCLQKLPHKTHYSTN